MKEKVNCEECNNSYFRFYQKTKETDMESVCGKKKRDPLKVKKGDKVEVECDEFN